MSGATLIKLRASPMTDILPRLGLSGEAAALAAGEAESSSAFGRLVAAGLLNEAAKLLAHALPHREAVWWACMCARHTAPADLPAPDQEAVTSAEQWVRRPTDEIRRAAFDHAQLSGFGSPEAWAAVAAFWSGDSMSPVGQPKTAPAPHLTGTAVIGSVVLSAVRGFPERRDARLGRFVASGREIADGGAGRLEPEGA